MASGSDANGAHRRIFGLPRMPVLAAGGIYLAGAIALWTFYLAADAPLPYDDTIDQGDSSDISMFHELPPPPPRFPPTAIDPRAVGAAVLEAAGGSGAEPTRCAPASGGTGIGLWTCTYATAGGRMAPARIEIDRSGDYRGVLTDSRGVERGFGGCCLRPGR